MSEQEKFYKTCNEILTAFIWGIGIGVCLIILLPIVLWLI